ncbi:MAG: alpha-L-rhamnosidase [Adhaeribacter sp.]|nr:alpha-L-rhamnosidase [Adhaeribacter sp.]
MTRFLLLLLLVLGSITSGNTQNISVNPRLLNGHWPAFWITCPEVPQRDYGVYHFRKNIHLPAAPAKFIIHVSGDNRYRLFVNGQAVCNGPARGDLYNWNFETVDIAPFLKSGGNIISAMVWNMGEHAPVAQISNQTAFVVQGDSELEKIINTDKTWKVTENVSYTPCSTDNSARLKSYMVVGPGDDVNAATYPWGWESLNFDDTRWQAARQLVNPAPLGYGTDNLWTLVPRSIPLMEETQQRLQSVRRTTGLSEVKDKFLDGKSPLVIPANTKASILFDQGFNTVAYPELITSGGRGAAIKLTYAEALFKNGNKGNRNEIEGKEIIGNYDIFRPDGGNKRLFRPLWLRTFRYLQVDIETKDQPLTLLDLYGQYTGYPFKAKATFASNDKSLKEIWQVGWRTARLCAGETYYDCPYYEQLQYEADTRIQALISLYVTGDDRLVRKAITDFYNSRVPEGLTQGRYPSNRIQVIPTFSLFWVSMLYDYWMHRPDEAFVKQYLTAARGVLDWYEKRIDPNKKMLGPMKWWNFVDYSEAFTEGTPEGAEDGNSAIITLQYIYTLQQAAQLFDYFNQDLEAAHYKKLALELSQSTYRQCFDHAQNRMANTPDKNKFSQHAGIMGVLTGTIPASASKEAMENVLQDATLGPATFYYRFYLTQALKKAGMADLYYSQLKPWRNMLAIGLTTFAEKPEPARSDCHAWSASPNYDFLATICGIVPDKPGFATVRIAPALGELIEASATMPHPKGDIKVNLERQGKTGIFAEIILPPNLTGRFIWQDKQIELRSGISRIKFRE